MLGLLMLLAVAAPPAEKLPDRVDRARIVGAPVLDGATPAAEGLYIWLEDGAFRLSFVAPGAQRSGRRKYTAELSAKEPLTPQKRSGIELVRGGSGTLYASATVEPRERRVEGTVKGTDLTVSAVRGPKSRVPIFVGPTAEPVASMVTIGVFSPFKASPGP